MEKDYKLAKKRVKRRKLFYWHVTVYAGVNIFLFLINLDYFIRESLVMYPGITSEEIIAQILIFPYWWFHYPLISWSLLLFFNYCAVFGVPFVGKLDEKWESKILEAELKNIELKRRAREAAATEKKLDLKMVKEKVKLSNRQDDDEIV